MGEFIQHAVTGKEFLCPCCRNKLSWRKNAYRFYFKFSLFSFLLLVPVGLFMYVMEAPVFSEKAAIAVLSISTILFLALIFGLLGLELKPCPKSD
jgi:hypothetical protein